MKKIHIVLTSSDYYVPYTAITMFSILRHVSMDYRIVFHLISFDITQLNKDFLEKLKRYKDFDIHYILLDPKTSFPTPKQKNVHNVAYARLLSGSLLPEVERCIILDSDLIVMHDISELWDTDLEDKVLGLVKDPLLRDDKNELLKYSIIIDGKLWWETFDVPHEYPYTNSGVILLDLKKWREQKLEEKILDNLATCKNLQFYDQDVLFITCYKQTYYLDDRWNYLPTVYYSDVQLKQTLAKESFVYHFGGAQKPWVAPWHADAERWWELARQTPYYETILARNFAMKSQLDELKQLIPSAQPMIPSQYIQQQQLALVLHKNYFFFKYYLYKCLNLFCFTTCFGEKRKKYKNIISQIRHLQKLR